MALRHGSSPIRSVIHAICESGRSFHPDYLTQLRISHAKRLLARGARPKDVAPQVGLYDQSQLNRHFRRIVGMTPGMFSAKNRQSSVAYGD